MSALGLGVKRCMGVREEVCDPHPPPPSTPTHLTASVFSLGCVSAIEKARGRMGEGSRSGQISLFCDYEGEGEAKENKALVIAL